MDREEDALQWGVATEVLWGTLREKLSPDYFKDHPCSSDITGARKIIDDARTKILRAHPTEFTGVPHCDIAANDLSISWFCHGPLIDRHLGISLHEIPHPTNDRKKNLSCDEALKCFNKEVEKLESMRYQAFVRNIRDKRNWVELKNYIHCVFALSCDRMMYPPLNTKGKSKSD
ncbi:hypothetical protein BDZ89DRAFT_1153170 [Hymenopellis radicata]|nr:hypothetical protein BDZ89DRAFT_1153170 [Hymenopellis radicata]